MNIQRKISIFILLCTVYLCLPVYSSAADHTLSICGGYHGYRSYSQQNNSMPMGSGYPMLFSQSLLLDGRYMTKRAKTEHSIAVQAVLPSPLDSDSATGENFLVGQGASHWSVDGVYHLSFPLIAKESFTISHAFHSGIRYEFRNLVYPSGAHERTWDVNLFIGPSLCVSYYTGNKVVLLAGFDARFYLPYLNYGELASFDELGESVYSSPYYSFFYQTVLKLEGRFPVGTNSSLSCAIEREDLVGFANSERKFYPDDIIHCKFDKTFSCSIGYMHSWR